MMAIRLHIGVSHRPFQGYAFREQEDDQAVGLIRNGRFGRWEAGNQLERGGHIPAIDSPFLCPLHRWGSDSLRAARCLITRLDTQSATGRTI